VACEEHGQPPEQDGAGEALPVHAPAKGAVEAACEDGGEEDDPEILQRWTVLGCWRLLVPEDVMMCWYIGFHAINTMFYSLGGVYGACGYHNACVSPPAA